MRYSGGRKYKYIKWVVCILVLAVLAVAGLRQMKLQSVDSYRQEGQQAKEQIEQDAGSQAPSDEMSSSENGAEDGKISCTVQIRCDSLVQKKDEAAKSMKKYIPSDGTVLKELQVNIEEGSSAYDVLSLVCEAENIPLDAEYTPLYKSYYVKGIAHLYAGKAGKYSGWLYQVNGKSPEVAASDYTVEKGDSIVWGYTCDGEDAFSE